jgi:hypothetical protein
MAATNRAPERSAHANVPETLPMTDWTAGYVADIGDTHGDYPELNPARPWRCRSSTPASPHRRSPPPASSALVKA